MLCWAINICILLITERNVNSEVYSECFDLIKNKCVIHKSTNMQLIEIILCGISVLQLREIVCEPANNLTKNFQH